jgi:hypothetical protein
MSKPQDTPKELDAIVDLVLAYRPKPKSKPAKKRRRMQRRIIAGLASKDGKPPRNHND